MNIPQIKFVAMTLKENIDLVKWLYFENNGALEVFYYVVQYFPELSSIRPDSSKEEIYKVIEKVVSKDYNKYEERIKAEAKRYNDIWKKYNNRYFEALSKYLNISFPENIKIIEASVGLTPVAPRYLDTFTFSIPTGIKDSKLVEIASHETCHFLWFQKWKDLYPNCPRREYDSPYNPWQYSEMVVDPILNSKEIHPILSVDAKGYDSFYEIKDKEGLYMMDVLKSIYETEKSIEEKIEVGYKYICSVLSKSKTK